MITGIYTITCILSGKMYVGYATDIKKRWETHKSKLRRSSHNNEYLQSSWNKYGEGSFKFEVLEECDKEFLSSQEHYWCNILNLRDRNFGYNCLPTHPYKRNHTHSKETKLKIREKRKHQTFSEETRRKISERGKGRKMSQEHKDKLLKLSTGRRFKHSEEAKEKISQRRGWNHSPETKLAISLKNKENWARRKSK